MKFLALAALFALGVVAAADFRAKRQVNYQFPGPRHAAGGGDQDDSQLYQVPRRQFQAQPVQAYASPPAQQPRSYAAQPAQRAPAPSYAAPQQQAAPRRQQQATRYAQQNVKEEEEEDNGPDRLALLLEGSKFSCSSKKDGYYADNSVSCQAFHYCVGGARHSWACPENTVFHQVHLNCVPSSQDICGQSEKYHFVNDYLHKPLEQRGPNNTILYAQRYYPEGYAVGDDLVPPPQQSAQQPRGGQAYEDQGYPEAAPQPQYRQPQPAAPVYQSPPSYAPPRQAYSPPRQAYAAQPQAAPAQPAYRSYGASVAGGVPVVPQAAPAPRRQAAHSARGNTQSYGYQPQGEGRYY